MHHAASVLRNAVCGQDIPVRGNADLTSLTAPRPSISGIQGVDGGTAAPDGPPAKSTIEAGPTTRFLLPPASITILRGRVTIPK
jgi:hypothetical protein